MLKALEKRLGKVEKTVDDRINTEIEAQKREQWREQFRELRSTPEGRRLLRKLSMESAEQMLSAMQARKRAQIAKMVSPEQLERLKKQWAEEDAKDQARRKELAEWRERMEARGSIPCDCRDCAPAARGTGSEAD